MAYYSGSANSYADLATVLLTHAQTDGWVLTGDVLSKAGVYFRIQSSASAVTILGCTDNAISNPAPNIAQIAALTYPCSYEVFGFAQEFYMVVKYSTDHYQWIAFGKSTVPGLTGSGAWFGAAYSDYVHDLMVTSLVDSAYPSSALFWSWNYSGNSSNRNSFVHHGLYGKQWDMLESGSGENVGIRYADTLLKLLPSAWSTETALVPIKSWVITAQGKISLTAELEHARHLRIDNLTPGDILTLGADRWKVFPWRAKNTIMRDGERVAGSGHSGTFGWAIRYEGP